MLDPKHPLAELLRRDQRFHFDAYVFVFDALRFGQERLGLGAPTEGLDDSELEDAELDDSELDDSELYDSEIDESELESLGLEAADLAGDHFVDPLSADEDRDDADCEHDAERHVTGAELCYAIQQYAVDRFGLLARSVLAHWGIRKTGDFGEIVFNLIDIGQMRKTDSDRREDFDDVYDFAEAFNGDVVFAAGSCGTDE